MGSVRSWTWLTSRPPSALPQIGGTVLKRRLLCTWKRYASVTGITCRAITRAREFSCFWFRDFWWNLTQAGVAWPVFPWFAGCEASGKCAVRLRAGRALNVRVFLFTTRLYVNIVAAIESALTRLAGPGYSVRSIMRVRLRSEEHT